MKKQNKTTQKTIIITPEKAVLSFLGFYNRPPEYPKNAKRSIQKYYEQNLS